MIMCNRWHLWWVWYFAAFNGCWLSVGNICSEVIVYLLWHDVYECPYAYE